MSLQSLSTELFSHIWSFVVAAEVHGADRFFGLRKPSLKHYACVSRRWQEIVELRTFSAIELKSTDVDQFQEIFASKHRQLALKRLNYTVVLPAYSQQERVTFESKDERRQVNDVFVLAISRLFEALNTWSSGSTVDGETFTKSNEHPYLSLHLKTYSPITPPTVSRDGRALIALRTADSIIDFPTDNNMVLPVVSNISELSFETARLVHMRALNKITTALPCLSSINLKYPQPLMKREVVRREQWHALGQMANDLAQCSSLESLELFPEFSEPYNHSFNPGDMRQSGTLVDDTSQALHNLAMRPGSSLQTLKLRAGFLVSPQLFWPYDSELQLGQAHLSSNLEYIEIACNIRSPEGTWYYTGDPNSVSPDGDEHDIGVDNNDDRDTSASSNSHVADYVDSRHEARLSGAIPLHLWRTEIDETTFNPLLTTIVHTILRLPRLKEFNFLVGCTLSELQWVFIECADAGHGKIGPRQSEPKKDAAVRRWGVGIGRYLDWELPVEIETLMKKWTGEEGFVVKYPVPSSTY